MEKKLFSALTIPGDNSAGVSLNGGALQIFLQTGTVDATGQVGIGLTGTVDASGTLTSDLFVNNGLTNFAFGAKLTQAGTLLIQRYLDAEGTIVQGAAVTQALTANTAGVLNLSDTKPWASGRVSIINGGTVAGTLSLLGGLLQAS